MKLETHCSRRTRDLLLPRLLWGRWRSLTGPDDCSPNEQRPINIHGVINAKSDSRF